MKLLVTLSFCLTLLITTEVKAQNHEINKLDKEVELKLDSAAKHMVKFILTQKEEEYTKATDLATNAEQLNNDLVSKLGTEKGMAAKMENAIIEDRKEEIASYKNPILKTTVLAEKKAVKTENVKFHGESYKLSKKGKVLFDTFNSYLPRN